MKVNCSRDIVVKRRHGKTNVLIGQRNVLLTSSHDDGCSTLWLNTLFNNFSIPCILHTEHRIITINTQKWSKNKAQTRKLKFDFLTFIGWWSQWSSLKFYKKRLALHGLLAPPSGFITRWTSNNQILILKCRMDLNVSSSNVAQSLT